MVGGRLAMLVDGAAASVVAVLAAGVQVVGLGRDGVRVVSVIAASTSGIRRQRAVLLPLERPILPQEGAVAVRR